MQENKQLVDSPILQGEVLRRPINRICSFCDDVRAGQLEPATWTTTILPLDMVGFSHRLTDYPSVLASLFHAATPGL